MDDLTVALIIAGLSLVPLPLLFRVLHPKIAIGISLLVGLGCAALAVLFFWLWQWSQHPVLAYVDAITYGSLALLAALLALSRWLSLRDEQRMAGS